MGVVFMNSRRCSLPAPPALPASTSWTWAFESAMAYNTTGRFIAQGSPGQPGAWLQQFQEKPMATKSAEENKALVLKAFDTLFNKREYDKAAEFWSEQYIQHSAHIAPG